MTVIRGKVTSAATLHGKSSAIQTVYNDAYMIAVRNGFEGTEEEWLESLKPVKGVDYFTEEDIQEISEYAKPVKGVDYWTETDKQEILEDVLIEADSEFAAFSEMRKSTEQLDIARYEKGSLNASGNSDYRIDSRARTIGIHTAEYDKTLYSSNGVKGIVVYFYDEEGNQLRTVDWCAQVSIPAGSRYRLILSIDPYADKTVYHELSDILANFYFTVKSDLVNEYDLESNVKGLMDTLGESIPDYVEEEAMRVVDAVIAAQSERTINIAALTDWHIYTNGTGDNVAKNNWAAAKHAIEAIAMISKRIKLDAVACLGDYIVGDSYYSVNGWLDILGTFNGYLADVKTDSMIKTIGNHDVGYGGSVFIPPAKSRPYIAAYNDHMVMGSLTRGYGYKDLPNYKVRLIVLNTCEFNNAGDYAKTFLVSDAQCGWFAQALDLSGKADCAEWQTLIISHHPLDWNGSKFPAILSAYENGSSVTVNGTTFDYSWKNAAKIIGNVHGHLHNSLKGNISGTSVKRWCVPNIAYDYSNTYSEWKESTTYPKTAGTAEDTAFHVLCIGLDTGVVQRIHYGAGYSDFTIYNGEGGGIYGNIDGYRLNSKGEPVEMEGRAITKFIPVVVGDIVRAANIGWNNSSPDKNYIAFYDANYNCLQSVSEANMRSFGGSYDIHNGGFKLTMLDKYGGISTADMAFVRISGAAPVANYTVTVNEEIDDDEGNEVTADNWYWLGQDENGDVLNGQGWLNNYRLSSTSGNTSYESGYVATGFIPFKHYDTITTGGVTTKWDTTDYKCVIAFYDASHNMVYACAASSADKSLGITVDSNGYFTWKLYSGDDYDVGSIAYVRLSAKKNGGDGTDFIINIT